jgi:hypothetical protein
LLKNKKELKFQLFFVFQQLSIKITLSIKL